VQILRLEGNITINRQISSRNWNAMLFGFVHIVNVINAMFGIVWNIATSGARNDKRVVLAESLYAAVRCKSRR
jgi:hypothetical protein